MSHPYTTLAVRPGAKQTNLKNFCLRGVPILAAILLIIFGLCHLSAMAATSQSAVTVEDSIEVSSALTKFSTSLFQVVAKQLGASENVFLSPFSVAAVLSMVHAGAKGNTAKQLKSGLHLTNLTDEKINGVIGNLVRSIKGDDNFTLEAANQVYVAENYQLTAEFQSALKEHFGAPAENVNFGAEKTRLDINKWVEDFTHQKIKDLLPGGSLDSLTKLVLVNAVYFKGNWLRKFDSALTKVEPFFLGSKDNKMDAKMMHIEADFRSGYVNELKARVVELPYVGRKLSMFIVLPDDVDGLPALEAKLSENLNFMNQVDQYPMVNKLHVAIPKFKVEGDVQMKQLLIELGMGDSFDENVADFSGMSGKKDLYISQVFHKSFIEVNEEGSEAAAATGAVMMTRMMILPMEPSPPFVADHPFMYYIRDVVNKSVLFVGHLAKPPSH